MKLSLFASSAIALGLSILPVSPSLAQSPTPTTENSQLGLDLKLNPQQRRAIEMVGGFALDQMENILSNGFNPQKLNRVEVERQSESLRQSLSSLRLDDQQKAVLRTILRSAREQMRRQLQTP
jgi:hypothetical protein